MRINSITVRSYRVHKELTVELDRSLTILGGPNKAGKSTLIEAAHRALFLRARTTGETQKSMVSKFYPGHPEVEVCFETGDNSYRLVKRFGGTSGTASLTAVSGPNWQGEEAEVRLSELLQVEATGGGRGVGKRLDQQWAHLWVVQGAAGEDPMQHATHQRDSLIARLQSQGGAAAMQSAWDASVAQNIAQRYEGLFRQNGKPRVDSELGRALQAETAARSRCEKAKETLAKRQHAATQYLEAERTIADCEQTLEKLQADLADVQQKLEQVASLRTHEQDLERAAESAAESHKSLVEVDTQMRKMKDEIENLLLTLAPKKSESERLLAYEDECLRDLRQAERDYDKSSQVTRAARRSDELALAYVTLYEKTSHLNSLRERFEQVVRVRQHLAELEAELTSMPAITLADVESLRQLEANHSHAIAALKAMAAGVEVLASDLAVKVGDQTLEVGQTEILTEESEIAIGSAIRLRITPGGGTRLLDARQQAREASSTLQDKFDALGIDSITRAVELCGRRQKLESQIKADQDRLADLGAESIDKQLSAANRAQLEAETAVKSRSASIDDFATPSNEAEARSVRAQTLRHLQDSEADESRCKIDRDGKSQLHENARRTREHHQQDLQREEVHLAGLEAQFKLLTANHGEAAERSTRLAELFKNRKGAEDKLADVRKSLTKLQPEVLEHDKLRFQRAINKHNVNRVDADKKRSVASGVLQSDGSTDPQAELARAQASLQSAEEHIRAVQQRADAIQLLHKHFLEAQRTLADQFTRPLVDRIKGYVECLFGAEVEVALQLEHNTFVGLELIRPDHGPGALPFDSLSAGTQEQLAAAVRLAMAEILADGHDDCLPLVFDDAFAYSDPTRVETLQRMLDLAASRGLQIIIVTCNPSDYATLGAREVTLGLQPPSPEASSSRDAAEA